MNLLILLKILLKVQITTNSYEELKPESFPLLHYPPRVQITNNFYEELKQCWQRAMD